jgi:hypothetical protein
MASDEKVSGILYSVEEEEGAVIFLSSWGEKDSLKSDFSNPVDFK